MTTTYRLIEVRPLSAVCDACGRECPERHEIVEDCETGKRLRLGTACAWRIAGIKPTDRIEARTEGTQEGSAAFIMSWMGAE